MVKTKKEKAEDKQRKNDLQTKIRRAVGQSHALGAMVPQMRDNFLSLGNSDDEVIAKKKIIAAAANTYKAMEIAFGKELEEFPSGTRRKGKG